jgi:isoleucyl-tRNA synthetase
MSENKRMAYDTLFECLMVTSQLMAAVAPFFADWLYKNISDGVRSYARANNFEEGHVSVHLTDLAEADASLINTDLEQRMDYAQRISSLVLSLRKKEKLRVRQPLQRIMLPVLNNEFQKHVEDVRELILSEVNIKEIEFITDTGGLLSKKAKPNFKTLGRRLGKQMKSAAEIISNLDQDAISEIEKTNQFKLDLDGQVFDLTMEDFEIVTEDIPGWQVATDGPLVVALDMTLTDELIAEGYARDLVNRIQNLRKQKDFNVTDRIDITVGNNPDVEHAVSGFNDYIKGETLADSLQVTAEVDGEEVEWVDGSVVIIDIRRR